MENISLKKNKSQDDILLHYYPNVQLVKKKNNNTHSEIKDDTSVVYKNYQESPPINSSPYTTNWHSSILAKKTNFQPQMLLSSVKTDSSKITQNSDTQVHKVSDSSQKKRIASHTKQATNSNIFHDIELHDTTSKAISGLFVSQYKEYKRIFMTGNHIPCWVMLKDHCLKVPTIKAISKRIEKLSPKKQEEVIHILKRIGRGIAERSSPSYGLFLIDKYDKQNHALAQMFQVSPIENEFEVISLGDFKEQLMEFCDTDNPRLHMPTFTQKPKEDLDLRIPKSRL